MSAFQTAVRRSRWIKRFPSQPTIFWAYLSAGFLLLFAFDQAAATNYLSKDSWTVVESVIALSAAYAAGQLVASVSSFVFEKMLVGRLLGYPRDALFELPRAGKWLRRLMPSYFDALPPETQRRALAKGQQLGVTTPGEALFWPAYSYVRSNPATAARVDTFLNLYGFCRNIALVALVDACVFYWSYLTPNGQVEFLWWARLSLVTGIGMAFRYLKFYRHFAVEVFTSWAFAN